MPQQVKIVTGWSNPGGSTICIINLAKKLIDSGYDVEVFGPHDWHIHELARQGYNVGFGSKYFSCKEDDIVISHFAMLGPIKAKKKIYWCHEMSKFIGITDSMMEPYDKVVFVSEVQRKSHSLKSDKSIVIPNIIEKIKWSNPNNKVAGVIGSIDANKQSHISVQRALDAGFEKVYLYGNVTDKAYYEHFIAPLLSDKVQLRGHCDNKEEMYNSIEAVYHSSKIECLPTIQGECLNAKIPYFGLDRNMREESDYEFNNNIIIERWKEVLE